MRTAVITIAAGRHAHLARQAAALRRVTPAPAPARRVVVAMGDEDERRRSPSRPASAPTSCASP